MFRMSANGLKWAHFLVNWLTTKIMGIIFYFIQRYRLGISKLFGQNPLDVQQLNLKINVQVVRNISKHAYVPQHNSKRSIQLHLVCHTLGLPPAIPAPSVHVCQQVQGRRYRVNSSTPVGYIHTHTDSYYQQPSISSFQNCVITHESHSLGHSRHNLLCEQSLDKMTFKKKYYFLSKKTISNSRSLSLTTI